MSDEWINFGVELDENDDCPFHKHDHHPACWACFRADAYADPESLEEEVEE